ncbi:hypothetical protein ALC56_02635 [Trachymyrmex septentrionalis]|uniref:Uncharacterized protein n=1 Tax=Trachymyrmex septentrionalis TaxID=34720 RepID=A0A195FQT8_9HYME|nr:hypothetical protein ALC56_02635 [Trachymyrmex septentrionalis]
MNEAKEKWMPEIYCLGASTPYAYTWPGGARLDLPGNTCGVDLVNTTSSIVEAKRPGLPNSILSVIKSPAALCVYVSSARVCSARPCAALGRHPPESRIGDRGRASGRRERSEARPRRTAT